QQSVGTAHVCPSVEHAGTWHVRGLPASGHVRPAQQSVSVRQKAVAMPHAGAAVHVPFVQLSPELQQGFVGPHVSFVPPHTAGATHVVVPSRSGSRQESPALQHATSPPHVAPVEAHMPSVVQTFAVQLSAALQHGTPAQEPPVPAH
ncbi:MAG TPA: hypothetical protein VF894_04735, partial [Anaeromyxobacter sp.]